MSENAETKKEYTLSIGKTNLYAFFMIFPISAITFLPYILIWNFETFWIGAKEFKNLFAPIFIFGIIVHELLHGITWALFAKKGFQSIKFGINGLTPYCHCKEPLKANHYRLGGAMPLIIMGIAPSIAGLIFHNGLYLCIGIFFIWTAGGDIISLFMLRKLGKNVMISDHPDKMGFYVT